MTLTTRAIRVAVASLLVAGVASTAIIVSNQASGPGPLDDEAKRLTGLRSKPPRQLASAVATDVEEKKPLSTIPVAQTERWTQSWWMARHEEKREQVVKAGGKIDLVMIGDSILYGFETHYGREAFERYYGGRRVLNLGFSGDLTEHVLWRIENGALDGLNPKLVLVSVGTNNAGIRREESVETAAGIEAILDGLKKRLPTTKILLLAILPRGENPDNPLRRLNAGTNRIIRTFADDPRVFWLDINSRFLGDGGVITEEIMPDRLHLSPKGYQVWAEAVEPTVKQLMGE